MCEILFSFVFPLLLGKWVEGSDQHRRKGFFTFLSPATMVFRALPFALLQSAVRSGPCLVLGLAKSNPSKSQKSSFIRTVEENPLQCTGVLVHSALLYFLPLHYSALASSLSLILCFSHVFQGQPALHRTLSGPFLLALKF